MIRYRRTGGLAPRDREQLDIAGDGRFTLWRTVARERAGRFGGTLPHAELETLRAAVERLGEAAPLHIRPPLDAAVENVVAGGAQVTMGHHEEPPGTWAPLVRRLRALVDDLTAHPVAAVELGVAGDGSEARLRHRGTQAAVVCLDDLEVEATLVSRTGLATHLPSTPAAQPRGLVCLRPDADVLLARLRPPELSGGAYSQVAAYLDLLDGTESLRARLVATSLATTDRTAHGRVP